MTIDDNLWDNLEAEVDGRTFELGWDKTCRPDRDCRVEIVIKRLDEVSALALVYPYDFHAQVRAIVGERQLER